VLGVKPKVLFINMFRVTAMKADLGHLHRLVERIDVKRRRGPFNQPRITGDLRLAIEDEEFDRMLAVHSGRWRRQQQYSCRCWWSEDTPSVQFA
jgi:hypothetical protein